jgi:anti-anti-sigma regulatory factor
VNRFRREHDSDFELQVDAIGGVLGLTVRGSLIAADDQLRQCFDQAVRGGRPVVLDLTEATDLDAAGVETLMDGHRMLAMRLRVVVERGGPVHQALRHAGVSHVLALHGSRAEALAASGG